jgi:hypothetical protein
MKEIKKKNHFMKVQIAELKRISQVNKPKRSKIKNKSHNTKIHDSKKPCRTLVLAGYPTYWMGIQVRAQGAHAHH